MSEQTDPDVVSSDSAEPRRQASSASSARADETPSGRVIKSIQRWWQQEVFGSVDQAEVIEKHREDCALSERYVFMTAMSGGIAVLGLLLPSTAVVIGAMLLSPLMGPIMGLGFALAIGDYQWLKQSARSLAWGSVIAIGLCAVLVFLSPIQTITTEIASRTQPNLFDLLVALFSGMAGAYATIRGRAGAIVGVAIATALMPPLAVIGFGLATLNWTVFSGALLLYVTNFITIALTAWAMARLYGFRTSLSERQSQAQNFAVVVVFIGLAVPLAFSLQQIAFQTNSQRVIRDEISEAFVRDSEISRLDVDFRSDPITVGATIYTPQTRPDAEVDIERALAARLGQPMELNLVQYQVGTSASAAEQAQLSAARASEEAAELARAEALALRLSLVAGVAKEDVVIDRTRRRAMVRARRLEGATLAAYRALEQRIVATEPDWTIELLPPVGELPDAIPFQDDGPTIEGARALSTIEWASRRIDLPIVLIGDPEEGTQAAEILAMRGVSVRVEPGAGALRADWAGAGE
ncbi:MAG: TIGR00341 family protein [Erythrobacter sp.]|nr:TIGR00341 family protein [Erythrobacter sp.]